MPVAAKRPCRHAGCNQLASGGSMCEVHRRHKQKQHDEKRGSAADRGYDSKWRQAREGYLRKHPLCVHCQEANPPRLTAATVVDHIIPHRGDKVLFWDSTNWQPLCKRHHDIKTATEDGGFGQGRGV